MSPWLSAFSRNTTQSSFMPWVKPSALESRLLRISLGKLPSHANRHRHNYARTSSIRTDTITEERDRQSKKAKITITLEKSPQFDQVLAEFEVIRAENEKLDADTKAKNETKTPKPPVSQELNQQKH